MSPAGQRLPTCRYEQQSPERHTPVPRQHTVLRPVAYYAIATGSDPTARGILCHRTQGQTPQPAAYYAIAHRVRPHSLIHAGTPAMAHHRHGGMDTRRHDR